MERAAICEAMFAEATMKLTMDTVNIVHCTGRIYGPLRLGMKMSSQQNWHIKKKYEQEDWNRDAEKHDKYT